MRGLKKRILRSCKVCRYSTTTSDSMKGLDGLTPSEACGIEIKGDNKLITLIQNASQKAKVQ